MEQYLTMYRWGLDSAWIQPIHHFDFFTAAFETDVFTTTLPVTLTFLADLIAGGAPESANPV